VSCCCWCSCAVHGCADRCASTRKFRTENHYDEHMCRFERSCRSIAERALRNVVANKEAEAARLRGEVQRLRRAQEASPQATSTSGSQQQQSSQFTNSDAGVQEAVADPAARQAVLDAAVAAKEKPTALLHQLER
jgi:hypothetical protein